MMKPLPTTAFSLSLMVCFTGCDDPPRPAGHAASPTTLGSNAVAGTRSMIDSPTNGLGLTARGTAAVALAAERAPASEDGSESAGPPAGDPSGAQGLPAASTPPGAQSERVSEIRAQLDEELGKLPTGEASPGLIRKWRRELAEAGDATERALILQSLGSSDLRRQSEALADAGSVGGPDMIAGLVTVLKDPSPGGRVSPDEGVLPPRRVAASILAKLVQDAPIPRKAPSFYTDDEIQAFLAWWESSSK